MLEELDCFEGVLVATSNLKHHLDPAIFRRFLFSQEISMPDSHTRSRILDDSIKLGSLPVAIKPLLQDLSWSPAQLRNIERKIRQFEFIDFLDPALIQWVFEQEGILSKRGSLGFIQKKFRKLSQTEDV
jgi:AAA+ superfamily predicted ATPase